MLFIVFHLVRVQTSLQTDWNAYKATQCQEPTIIHCYPFVFGQA